MGWKTQMDRNTIISQQVETYLLSQGFEYGIFKPTFTDETTEIGKYCTLGFGQRCLTLENTKANGEVYTIYITSTEAYLEVKEMIKTPANAVARPSYIRSKLLNIPVYVKTIDDIDDILNQLTSNED